MESIGILGAGALGVMYGSRIETSLGSDKLCFIADEGRRARYQQEGHFANGRRCSFRYLSTCEQPVDLLLVAVKFGGLNEALELATPFVGRHTVIISVLNGIASEDIIVRRFGDRVLYCEVHGMDATKQSNRVSFSRMGTLVYGEKDDSRTERVAAVADLLGRAGIEYQVADDIMHSMWNKLMLNTGVNQAAAVYKATYGDFQCPGRPREDMIAAMREAMGVAAAEGIALTEADIQNWLDLIDRLSPQGMTSMLQDVLAGRHTEVELFSGTICSLGEKHGIPTPVNDRFYESVSQFESGL